MAKIISLRRVRKAKARDAEAAHAEANRVKHGVAKPVRELARTRKEKDKKAIDAHRLDETK